MKKKTQAPVREGVKKATAPVREGLAYLIEDALERSEVVLSAEAVVDKLNDMAVDLSEIEAKDIMPLQTAVTNAFGPEVWQNFYQIATEQVRQLITSVQSAQAALNNEVMRLKQAVEGGSVSDMAMDSPSKPMMPGVPDEPGIAEPGMAEPGMAEPGMAEPGLADTPPDMDGNAEDDMLGADPGFAGREKKEAVEGRKVRGKKIAEDMVPMAPHSHESHNLDANISNMHLFHGGAGKLADAIKNMIRTEELSLEQRQGLANILSNLSSLADDPRHWSGADVDKMIEMKLQSANIWKVESPAVAKIVTQLKKLAHLVTMKHEGIVESNIAMLRKAADPDSVILKTFRTKLAEHKDGQMAAIRTARYFAIDVEDVVSVVKEAAARRPFPLTEFKADLDPDKKGMFKGKNVADLQKMKTDLGKQSKDAQGRGKRVPKDVATKEREVNYAIRAKRGWKGGTARDGGKVEEDGPALSSAPLFPVEQGTAASTMTRNPMNAADPSAPMSGGGEVMQAPNQSNSTRKPLTPADMRMRQQAQQSAQQQKQAIDTAVQDGVNNAPDQATDQQGQQKVPQFQPPGKEMRKDDPANRRGFMQR